MNRPDLSFIVPMYNCADHIAKCLDALFSIDAPLYTYEIIFVDDGSTDDSLVKVKSWLYHNKKNKQVCSIEKIPHSGPGYARNVGLIKALGEFVWFIDADDEIIPDTVSSLLEQSYTDNLDILGFNIYTICADGVQKKFREYNVPDKGYYKGKEFIKRHWDYLGTPWRYLYRRKFLIDNGLKFPNEIFHEDEIFSIRAFMACEKMGISVSYSYKYFRGNGHIMSIASPNRIHSLIRVCDVFYQLYLEENADCNPLIAPELLKRIVLMIQQLLYVCINCRESFQISANEKRILRAIRDDITHSVYLIELQKSYGKKLDYVLTKFNQLT